MRLVLGLAVASMLLLSTTSCEPMMRYNYKKYYGVYTPWGGCVESYDDWKVRQAKYKAEGGKGRLRPLIGN